MLDQDQARHLLADLFTSQIQAVLATACQQQPYTSLMAFAATDDLRRLLFATNRSTHKYANLQANPRIAMLIDNRSARLSDHFGGIAVTAIGGAHELPDTEKADLLPLYVAKQPNLKDFVYSTECAFMALQVEHYYIVSRFHDVTDLCMV